MDASYGGGPGMGPVDRGGGGNLIGDHAVSGGVTSEANPCSLFLIGIIINDKDDKGTLFSEVGVEVVHPVGIWGHLQGGNIQ